MKISDDGFCLLDQLNLIDQSDGEHKILSFLNTTYYSEQMKKKFQDFFYKKNTVLETNDFTSIGVLEDISYYSFYNGDKFNNTVESIKDKFTYWRKIKGDGNCFYRAILINYLEILIITSKKNQNAFFFFVKDIYFTDFKIQNNSKIDMFKENTLLVLLAINGAIVNKEF